MHSKIAKKTKIILATMLLGIFTFGSGSALAAFSAGDLAKVSHMKRSSISELRQDSRVFTIDKTISVKKSAVSESLWL